MQDASWVDRAAYPFTSRFFEVDGARMHYVDEGDGEPIVMVHGTPAWSFLYRDLIKALSGRYRCIAPDHLGYGLSDKPAHAAYRPEDHARRLHALVEHLRLPPFTLVVHDYGGPTGLSYAIERPGAARALVLFNTWMWSLRREPFAQVAGRVAGGPLGALLIRRLNLEARVLFRSVWGDRSKLSADVHRQYVRPFPRPDDRQAMWVLARELLASSEWYESLWSRRESIRDIPALLLWGMKDPIFGPRFLARWQALFTNARTITFPTAGHFVQDEEHDAVALEVARFLDVRRDGAHDPAG